MLVDSMSFSKIKRIIMREKFNEKKKHIKIKIILLKIMYFTL